jgi:hypothetical protein
MSCIDPPDFAFQIFIIDLMRKYFPKNSTLGVVYSVSPALKQDGTQFAISYLVFHRILDFKNEKA